MGYDGGTTHNTVLYGSIETLAIETHRSFRLSFHYTFRNRIGLIWASFLSHLETVEIASLDAFPILKNGYFVQVRSLQRVQTAEFHVMIFI